MCFRGSIDVLRCFRCSQVFKDGYSKDVLRLVSFYLEDTRVGLVSLVGLECLVSLMMYPWVWWILRVLWFKT